MKIEFREHAFPLVKRRDFLHQFSILLVMITFMCYIIDVSKSISTYISYLQVRFLSMSSKKIWQRSYNHFHTSLQSGTSGQIFARASIRVTSHPVTWCTWLPVSHVTETGAGSGDDHVTYGERTLSWTSFRNIHLEPLCYYLGFKSFRARQAGMLA